MVVVVVVVAVPGETRVPDMLGSSVPFEVPDMEPLPVPPLVMPPLVVPPIVLPPEVDVPIVDPPLVVPPMVEPPIVDPPIVEPPVVEPPIGMLPADVDAPGARPVSAGIPAAGAEAGAVLDGADVLDGIVDRVPVLPGVEPGVEPGVV